MTGHDRVRVGAIGLGRRSTQLRYSYAPDSLGRLVACADPRDEAVASAADRFGSGIEAFSDYRRMLDRDLDAVFVMSPDHTHEEIVVECLQRGVAVFAEKPLAISPDQCDRILAAAQQSGSKLYVGHNMRHLPVVVQMRRLIQDGAVGDVKAIWCRHFVGRGGILYFKDWNSERAHTMGLLLQKGVHDIDAIHWLAGAASARVTGMGERVVYSSENIAPDRLGADGGDAEPPWPPSELRGMNPATDVEDLSMMLMRLDNGVYASYQQCHFTPDYWRNFTVIGDRGRLENFGDEDGAVIRVWNSRASRYRAEADLTIQLPTSKEPHGGADRFIVDEFLRYVLDSAPVTTSPLAARDAVAAAYAATVSLRNGGAPVDVEPAAAELTRYFSGANQ
jgi:predicted dehydrogenase